jgi:hypothetical protein
MSTPPVGTVPGEIRVAARPPRSQGYANAPGVNQRDRDVALPQPTVHRYLNLLETSFLLVRLPAYAVNRTKRLIKTPKLYWGDVGLALHLGGLPEPTAPTWRTSCCTTCCAGGTRVSSAPRSCTGAS